MSFSSTMQTLPSWAYSLQMVTKVSGPVLPCFSVVPATRTTWVAGTTEKQGSTGPLTFVTICNEYAQDGRVCIVDENDIVYRTPGSNLSIRAGTLKDEPEPAPREPALT